MGLHDIFSSLQIWGLTSNIALVADWNSQQGFKHTLITRVPAAKPTAPYSSFYQKSL